MVFIFVTINRPLQKNKALFKNVNPVAQYHHCFNVYSYYKSGSFLVGGNVFTEKGLTFLIGGLVAFVVVLILKHYGQIRVNMEKIALILPVIICAIGLAMLLWGFYLNVNVK